MRRVSWRRSVNLLALGVFVAQVAFSMAAPLLPVYLAELGLERNLALWSGAIFSISFVTFGIMSPVWGSISDRYGKRPMILRAGLGMGLTYALMAVARDHVQLFLLRAINGALSGYIPAAITLATTLAPEPSLGWALGMIQSANAVGLITGPLIGGLVAGAVGIKASFVFAAVLLVLAALVPFFGVSESPARSQARLSLVRDVEMVFGFPSLRVLFGIFLFVQAAVLAVQPTIPLYVAKLIGPRDMVPLVSGLVFSLVGISTAIGCPLVVRIGNSHYRGIFVGSLFLAGVLNALQGAFGSILWLSIARFLFGFANAAITVSGNVLIAEATPREVRGRAYGILNSITSAGSIGGPLLGGYLGEHCGLASSFWGAGVLFLVAGVLGVLGARLWVPGGKRPLDSS